MENLADEILIKKISEGSIRAFEVLINRYKDRAYGLLLGLLRNKMDAEEALQDAFLKTYRNLKNFRGEAKFSTWFYKIVYNTGLTFLKGRLRKLEKITSSLTDDFQLSVEENFDPEENSSAVVNKLIELLPPKAALVVNLFYIDGLSIKEISEVTNYTTENVKVLLFRARRTLRKIILEKNYLEELI